LHSSTLFVDAKVGSHYLADVTKSTFVVAENEEEILYIQSAALKTPERRSTDAQLYVYYY